MKNRFGIVTVFFILLIVFCVRGTVMSKENMGDARENKRYAAWEQSFVERTRSTLAGQGYRNSGITMTWTRKNGKRTYTVSVHHGGISRLAREEQEQLVQTLLQEKFGDGDCEIQIGLLD
ncbi:MAG: hypothetical protein HFI62_05605 [Lachnospiraceae bacterium]|nr:hypothetical protein [Lachnospiraceae bacterium]